jgi:predicted methyltransferase
MKKWLTAFALSTLVTVAAADDALRAAIASSHRAPENVARDGARHPYETLTFFGIKPNMTVIELTPGGGWYTEILAPYLRDKGELIAASYDPNSSVNYFKKNRAEFEKKLADNPAVYGKVKLSVFEMPGKLDFMPVQQVDMVLTFRNLHNWSRNGDAAIIAALQKVFNSLKPGGVFGVVDHRLPASTKQDEKASSGYVHEAYAIKLAEAAGFKLAAKSEVNANPKDTADYPNGVWTLPPVYSQKDKDREKYQAIGESDRFTLKFVKP